MENIQKRQIYSAPLTGKIFELLPENVKNYLRAMVGEEDVAIKGGVVKFVILTSLILQNKCRDRKRWDAERKINDFDLVFIYKELPADLKKEVVEKFNRVEAKLAMNNIPLEAEDIDIIAAPAREAAIARIVGNIDTTINEVAMMPKDRKWYFYYTPQCYWALVEGLGVSNLQSGHFWLNAGRAFPSAFQMIRLIKLLVSGKGNKIYLPKWQLKLYFENYQKKVAAGEMPANAPLGFYSLVLMKNYFGDKPLLQKKAMVALYDLGFTDMMDPEMYIRQQERIFADAGADFSLADFTIEEVVDRYLESKKKKEEAQTVRQQARNQCEHEFETIDCDLCGKNKCAITACAKCGKNKNSGVLPCVLRLRQGITDPVGFYSIK